MRVRWRRGCGWDGGRERVDERHVGWVGGDGRERVGGAGVAVAGRDRFERGGRGDGGAGDGSGQLHVRRTAICELLNPANCDTATVTVTVGAASIDAENDAGAVASGLLGGTAVASVLTNDTLGGLAATVLSVSVAPVLPLPAGIGLSAAGAVTVAPGTAAGTSTFDYTICELLNPANCDTATVTVTVGAASIDAENDAGAVASGLLGGTAVASVLTNDTLGGLAATVLSVSVAPVLPLPAGIGLSAAGAVTVAPGTAAGSSTFDYTICELLNPANCDTATVTVTVGAASIDAENDSGAVASGLLGGTAVASVLTNDTLGGLAATILSVSVAPVLPLPAGIGLSAAGAVTVAPGTAAGSYTFAYSICELLNPANCDTATVTVTVNPAPDADLQLTKSDDIDPIAPGGLLTYTLQVVNLGPASATNVVVVDTLPPGVVFVSSAGTGWTCSGTAAVSCQRAALAVGAASPITIAVTAPLTPGTLTNAATVSSDTVDPSLGNNVASESTTVSGQIVAADDGGGVSSAAGGTAVADVLANDTLGGVPVTTSSVTLAAVGSPPAGIVLNPDGSVVVAAGTAANTYMFDYRICETAQPANCDTATVTVTVSGSGGGNAIVAADDGGGVSSAAGGTAVADVLANDTLGGVPVTTSSVTLAAVGSPPAGIVLNPDGSVVVAAGTAANTYMFDYRICETAQPANCDTATVTVTVSGSGGGNAIVAADDGGGVSSAAGGTAVADVLANDTLGGVPVTTSSVTLAAVGSPPAGIVLNPDGSVVVAAGTAANTYMFDYRICETAQPANCDTATVTVTVSGSGGGGGAAAPVADLSITKSAGETPTATGGPIAYTLQVENAGPDSAAGVVVTDTVPDSVSAVSVAGEGWACDLNGNVATCRAASLPVGAASPITLVATALRGGIEVTNSASVAATTSDPVPANNTSTVTSRIAAQVDLGVVKTASSPTYLPGKALTFTIVVRNVGLDAVAGANVRDLLPPALRGFRWSCSAVGGTCSRLSGTGDIDVLVDLGVGGRATFVLTGVLPVGTTGVILNRAAAITPPGTVDGNPSNDTASVAVRRGARPTRLAVAVTPKRSVLGEGAKPVTLRVKTVNVGRETAHRVVTCLAIPLGVTVAKATGGNVVSGRYCWRTPSLKPRQKVVFTIAVRGDARVAKTVTLVAGARAQNAPRALRKTAVLIIRPAAKRTGGFTG